VLETRTPGDLELRTTTSGVTLAPFKLTLKEAWYQSTFLITGYNVCAEVDFSGKLVEATGLREKHKDDFLFGAAGVPMQGTGLTEDGQYIRLKHFGGGWHVNKRGHRDSANSPSAVSFQYADGVMGAYGAVSENHSIAVDPTVIPRHAKVLIDGVGERFADDTGSAIRHYHIDNFLGVGEAVVSAWNHGGVNGTEKKVKYMGASK
jgi:3D (Asp-Asp-Asp) domain-containing protein